MIVLMRVRMSIICSENGLLVCSHGPLELAQSVIVRLRDPTKEEAPQRWRRSFCASSLFRKDVL